MSDAGQSPGRPLEGTLVLDLGQVYNGPYCGLLLGFLGARVIKIEPPTGDVVRARLDGDADPYSFFVLNSNKESVVLDLKTPQGRDLLCDLAEGADVLVENFAVGVMDRLGVGWETLRARNPRLVYASSTGFGLSGPYRDLPAMDLTVQAMSGVMASTGYADRPPVKAGPAVADFLAALHLCSGILAALLQRERTGEGQLVEISMQESALMSVTSALSGLLDHPPGEVPPRTDNRHPALAIAPYNVYAARDGYVAINCVAERHWRDLVDLMGRLDLLEDPRFDGPVGRATHMDEVDAHVGEWVGTHERDTVVEALRSRRIPCAPVLSAEEILADEHLRARGAFVERDLPHRGELPLPVSPIRLGEAGAPELRRVGPRIGEHTDAVLSELLGLSAEDVRSLREAGVTAPRPQRPEG